jgi:hypothetical protein
MFKFEFEGILYKVSFESYMVKKVHPEGIKALQKLSVYFGKKISRQLLSQANEAIGSGYKTPEIKTIQQMVTKVSIWDYTNEKEIGKGETICNPKDLTNRQVGKKMAIRNMFDNMSADHIDRNLILKFRTVLWDRFFKNYPKAK